MCICQNHQMNSKICVLTINLLCEIAVYCVFCCVFVSVFCIFLLRFCEIQYVSLYLFCCVFVSLFVCILQTVHIFLRVYPYFFKMRNIVVRGILLPPLAMTMVCISSKYNVESLSTHCNIKLMSLLFFSLLQCFVKNIEKKYNMYINFYTLKLVDIVLVVYQYLFQRLI